MYYQKLCIIIQMTLLEEHNQILYQNHLLKMTHKNRHWCFPYINVKSTFPSDTCSSYMFWTCKNERYQIHEAHILLDIRVMSWQYKIITISVKLKTRVRASLMILIIVAASTHCSKLVWLRIRTWRKIFHGWILSFPSQDRVENWSKHPHPGHIRDIEESSDRPTSRANLVEYSRTIRSIQSTPTFVVL